MLFEVHMALYSRKWQRYCTITTFLSFCFRYRIAHPLDFFDLTGVNTERTAELNTLVSPFWVFAEHSMYFTALILVLSEFPWNI